MTWFVACQTLPTDTPAVHRLSCGSESRWDGRVAVWCAAHREWQIIKRLLGKDWHDGLHGVVHTLHK